MIEFFNSKKNMFFSIVFLMVLFSCLSIVKPMAATRQVIVSEDGLTTDNVYSDSFVELYYNDNTPITLNWLIENPDYSVTVSSSTSTIRIRISNLSSYSYFSNSMTVSASSLKNYYETYKNNEDESVHFDEPITFALYDSGRITKLNIKSEGVPMSIIEKVIQSILLFTNAFFETLHLFLDLVMEHIIFLLPILIPFILLIILALGKILGLR